MIKTVTIEKIFKTEDYLEKEIRVAGFVRSRRDSKGFSFIDLNDGTTVENLQVIAFDTIPVYKEKVLSVTTGSSIAVEGKVRLSEGKGQKYELVAEKIHIYGIAPQDYPLQKKHHSFEYLREIGHLRPRTNTIGAVMRMRSGLSFAIHSFFREQGFYYVHTPIITTSDCEGAGEMFTVTTFDLNNIPKDKTGKIDFSKDFFGKEAHLTVSGQLEGEICALALSKIYTFGPTFRAENSNTPRHLAEFWMIEPEAAFYHLLDNMDLAENFIKYLVNFALEKHEDELSFFNQRIDNTLINRLENIANSSFERISYTEAIKHLEKNNEKFTFKVSWGSDLQAEHERYLTEALFKKPVIVYDYPKQIKAFYMRQNDDGKTVAAMDLLVPKIGELIGGSEREERYELLLNRIKELDLKEENYWWYLDLRKFGGAPHSGFGLGFERLMLFTTGLQNIRDVIPFPRTPKSADF